MVLEDYRPTSELGAWHPDIASGGVLGDHRDLSLSWERPQKEENLGDRSWL